MNARKWILRGAAALIALCALSVALLFLANRNLPTESAVVDRLSEPEKARLAEFFQLRHELGGRVWPGWDSVVIPVIVYNEAYAFLVGLEAPADGWMKVPQNRSLGGPWERVPGETFASEPYYRQRLPDSGEIPEAFTVRVGDRWVASMPTMEWMEIRLANQFREQLPGFLASMLPYPIVTDWFLRGSDGYVSLVAHESFHAYQGMIAPDELAAAENAASRLESRYPWGEAALQDAWQLEIDLLADALKADSETESVDLARQFLAQRSLRRREAGLNNALVEYESAREWLEGSARYVELEIWRQANVAAGYEPVSALKDDPDFTGYTSFDRRWSQEIDQMRRMADDEGDGRFYYTGMAQAVLLDRLSPDWRNEALAEGRFLEEILAAAVMEDDG